MLRRYSARDPASMVILGGATLYWLAPILTPLALAMFLAVMIDGFARVLEHFFDPERGGFFSVSDDHTGLIARRKDLEDAPIPSGGSAACFGLLRLARFTGEARYEDAALSLIKLLHTIAPEHPLAFGHLLRAIDFHLGPVREVALAGDDLAPLARVVRGGYFPYVVLAGGEGDVPLLRDRGPVDGQAAAYVCEHFTCRLPVTTIEDLIAALAP